MSIGWTRWWRDGRVRTSYDLDAKRCIRVTRYIAEAPGQRPAPSISDACRDWGEEEVFAEINRIQREKLYEAFGV